MRFSIIIPIYNGERFIRESVESVLRQSFLDYELILVNDGSTDSSLEICKEYQKTGNNIKIIDKPNGGQASARNKGLAISAGEYVVFLDCDDNICDNDFLKKLDRIIGVSKIDIVVYKYRDFYEDTGKIRKASYSYARLPVNQYEDTLFEMIRMDAFFCSAWSKSIRREVLIDNNILFDESSKCEDMDWYFKVVHFSKSIQALDCEIVQYRRHENSVTTTVKYKNIYDYVKFMDKWSDYLDDSEKDIDKGVLQQALAKLYVNLLLAYLQCTDPKKKILKGEILSFKFLLKYNMNPNVRKINLIYRVLGIHGVLFLLKALLTIRWIINDGRK